MSKHDIASGLFESLDLRGGIYMMYIMEALNRVERETLERVEKAGCAHACAPPCPFNRKMASLRSSQVPKEPQ